MRTLTNIHTELQIISEPLGLRAEVFSGWDAKSERNYFRLRIFDLDELEYLPMIREFPTLSQAKQEARRIVSH